MTAVDGFVMRIGVLERQLAETKKALAETRTKCALRMDEARAQIEELQGFAEFARGQIAAKDAALAKRVTDAAWEAFGGNHMPADVWMEFGTKVEAALSPLATAQGDMVLVQALEFFADEANWRMNGPLDPNSGNFIGRMHASAALAAAQPAPRDGE